MKSISIPLAFFALGASLAHGMSQTIKDPVNLQQNQIFVPSCGELKNCVCEKKKKPEIGIFSNLQQKTGSSERDRHAFESGQGPNEEPHQFHSQQIKYYQYPGKGDAFKIYSEMETKGNHEKQNHLREQINDNEHEQNPPKEKNMHQENQITSKKLDSHHESFKFDNGDRKKIQSSISSQPEQQEDDDSLYMRPVKSDNSYMKNASHIFQWKTRLSERYKSGEMYSEDEEGTFTDRFLMFQREDKILSIPLSKKYKLSNNFLPMEKAKNQDIFVIHEESKGIYSIFPLFTDEDLAMQRSKSLFFNRDACKMKPYKPNDNSQRFQIIKLENGKYKIKNLETKKVFQENSDQKIVFKSEKPNEPLQEFILNFDL
jgi:hypothetical protein